MGMTVSGLSSSGLDVGDLVSQLMTAERTPQDQLKTQQQTVNAQGSAWTTISSSIDALRTAATAVNTVAQARSSTASTSDSSRLTATADATAGAGSVTLRVRSLATAGQVASGGFASTGQALPAGTLTVAGGASAVGLTAVDGSGLDAGRHTLVITTGASAGGTAKALLDGTEYDIPLTGGPVTIGGLTLTPGDSLTAGTVDLAVATADGSTSLAGVAAALNGMGGPANAAAVDLGDGSADPARLVLTATQTGTAHDILVSGTGGLASAYAPTHATTDAVITMGSLTVTRPTNTVTDLLPGVTLNLVKADDSDVTVTVARDPAALTQKVTNFVNAINNALGSISKQSSSDPKAGTAGPLSSDSRVRDVTSRLYSAMSSAVLPSATAGTLSQIGIALQRDGTYSIDTATLNDAVAKDPDGVAALLASAGQAMGSATDAINGTNGIIPNAQTGITETSKDLQSRIDDWDTRLDLIQARYTQQFTALDVAINTLHTQQSWLTGQLSSLTLND